MNAYRKLTIAGVRAFFRDRTALFFSFFFPVFFMFLFGSLFGDRKGSNSQPKFPIGVVLEDSSPAVAWVPSVFHKVSVLATYIGTLDAEKEALRKGERRAVIVFPKDFSEKMQAGATTDVKILFDPAQQQASQITLSIVKQVLDGMEKRMSNRTPLLEAKEEPVTSGKAEGESNLRQIDYMIPGILAMTIMQLGIFTAIPIVNMREKGILKRLGATPLPRKTLIGSQITMRLIIAVFQTLVLLALGIGLYKFHVVGSWLGLLGLVLLGSLTFISIGAVLASIAKTQEGVMPLVQLTNLPMLFLSGMLFPVELMPAYLKPLINVIPATHLAEAMRAAVLATPSPHAIAVNLGVMAAWFVGCLLIATRIFRWE
jgi:ABC-2 type transport system permease protein